MSYYTCEHCGKSSADKVIVLPEIAETKTQIEEDIPHDARSSHVKRAISAYLFYASFRRPQIKETNPNYNFGEITMLIASEWKHMSEQNKKPFNELAKKDKARYESEIIKK